MNYLIIYMNLQFLNTIAISMQYPAIIVQFGAMRNKD